MILRLKLKGGVDTHEQWYPYQASVLTLASRSH